MSHTPTGQRATPAKPATPRQRVRVQRSSRPARTLWEEGRRPGRQVVALSVLCSVALARLDLAVAEELSLFFDLAFVTVCVCAALAVRPPDFFAVGVLPPLLMLGTITLLALVSRPAMAESGDGLVQAVVSGLAHHAGALVTGYSMGLVVLALRQIAMRRSGRLRTFT